MDIVFCLDKNILDSLKAIISSINYHTKRTVNYYVICPKKENRLFEDFINSNNLKNIKLGNFEPSDFILNLIKKCKYYFGSRISNYSRFFIKDTFPDLKKIIYLDTDMIILNDIGKLWDSVNLNENNFFASPKYILFHKLFYIKRLQYYYQYFNQSNYFNGGVFVTDLTFWDDKLYQKLFEITDNFLENDICHTFTEAILNTLFPNFIQLDPSWNCSGYGNNKWYYILKLRDSNYKPKIIHWSGPTKPWHKKNIYQENLWYNFFNNNLLDLSFDDDDIVFILLSYIYQFIKFIFNLFK